MIKIKYLKRLENKDKIRKYSQHLRWHYINRCVVFIGIKSASVLFVI